ncbi:MAG TPA: hypothetical protein VFI84_00625 [Candidatus Saccharimonadales bacterium]|nr:hypothetical protein [Candidatus Saccharimonadales bacterium]
MRLLHRLNQGGDTIVEVLVALAILGSALGIGYAAASSGLRGTQQASEHSQALKIAQAQAEMLEINSANSSLYNTANAFCYNSTTYTDWTGISSHPPASASSDPLDSTDYPGGCIQNFFHTSVAYSGTSPNDTFTITVRWAAITGHGNDQVQLNYRVHQSSGNGAIISAGGVTNASSTLEESGMSNAIVGCNCGNSGPNGDSNGSTDGSVWAFWSTDTTGGSVTTTTTTQHIYIYARQDKAGPSDASMTVKVGSLAAQTFSVSNTTPYMPFSYNIGSGLLQGTYPVTITSNYDYCPTITTVPFTCGPDSNLYVDRVVFSPT